jgi:hypothetical protein
VNSLFAIGPSLRVKRRVCNDYLSPASDFSFAR